MECLGGRVLTHSPTYAKVTIGLRLQLDGAQIMKEVGINKEECHMEYTKEKVWNTTKINNLVHNS